MSSGVSDIFIGSEFALAAILAFLKVGVAVMGSVGIVECAVWVFDFRLEIRGIDLLDLMEQRLVWRFIIHFCQHHRQCSYRL